MKWKETFLKPEERFPLRYLVQRKLSSKEESFPQKQLVRGMFPFKNDQKESFPIFKESIPYKKESIPKKCNNQKEWFFFVKNKQKSGSF